MVFNSIEFAAFLPIVFILYWFVFSGRAQRNWKGISQPETPSTADEQGTRAAQRPQKQLQNICLVAASYAFYAFWDWRFLGLTAFITLVTYAGGILVTKRRAKASLILTIILALLPLLVFKYHNFFISSLASLIPALANDRLLIKVILPVGISFYTFSALGYTIDVYQKKIEPTRDLITYAAFVSFFPQLLSGPIGRSTDLLPQYARPRTFDYTTAADGLRQFLWGLFKKVVVADGCAQYVDQVWANIQAQTGSTLLLAAVLYSFQIYADFSGYSDMAIGTAKLFGIRLRQNFACPYFSRDIAEFWRRWHISLTSWFRDYIYIPLGGSRCARWKILRNTLIVFLVSGLWHGADWTFVAWGAYHGLLLCLLILLGKSKRFKANTVAHDRLLPSLKEFGQMALTFALATLGWIIFRAESIEQFIAIMKGIIDPSLFTKPTANGLTGLMLCIIILAIVEWTMRKKEYGLEISDIHPAIIRYCMYLLILFLVFAFGGNAVNFVYFQF